MLVVIAVVSVSLFPSLKNHANYTPILLFLYVPPCGTAGLEEKLQKCIIK
jgi:hypothetical protein